MKEQEGKIFCIFDSTKGEINECIAKAFEIYLKDRIKYQEKYQEKFEKN